MPSGVTTGCAWPGRGESVTELMPFMNFLVHSYTCCSDRHASPYWTFICRWISTGFIHSLLKKRVTTLFFFAACCKRGRHLYNTTAPSCSIPASNCHLSATLQTMSITVVNLKDNRALFQIFIALLRFSFDSPSYIYIYIYIYIYMCVCVCVCVCARARVLLHWSDAGIFSVVCADTVMNSFGDFREHSGDRCSKSQKKRRSALNDRQKRPQNLWIWQIRII